MMGAVTASLRNLPNRQGVAIAGVAGLAGTVVIDPVAGGGAIILVLILGLAVPAGSAALLAIHALTGGRWGESLRPFFLTATLTLPSLLVALVCLGIVSKSVYPWAVDPSAAEHQDVAAYYLNAPAFRVRALLIAAGLGFLWWTVVKRPRSQLLNALALIVYAIAVSFSAFDWMMSLEPRWSSTALGAMTAIENITAALAIAAALRTIPDSDPAIADLAQLLIAAVLGVVYLGFMQFLVIWSGNLPDKSIYYVRRDSAGWNAVIFAALLVGGLLPLLTLLSQKARHSVAAVSFAGVCALAGLTLHWIWQVVPGLPAASVPLMVLAGVSLAALALATASYSSGFSEPRPP